MTLETRRHTVEALLASRPLLTLTPEPAKRRGRGPAKPKGVKFDDGKPQPRLLLSGCSRAVAAVVNVLTFGARKYAPDNWKKVETTRYEDALYRHLNAYHNGETHDKESGELHLAHAACCLMFLLEKAHD